jgi:hypothetical protein
MKMHGETMKNVASSFYFNICTVHLPMFCTMTNLHKTCVKHLNCKMYYQQLHLKHLCDLATY